MTETYEEFDFTDFQRQVIAEFRANSGRVGGMFEGSTLALLTTTGARSGLPRTSPLGYLEIDGQPVVIASAGGAPTHPAWYHNIRENPAVTVEVGTETYQALAGIPEGEERDRLFLKAVEQAPGYGDYQKQTTRVIPVVTLHRVDAQTRGLGDFLVEVHDWLRAELAGLRAEVDAIIAGRQAPADLVVQLRAHCAEFCGALSKHHGGEDHGAFPMLAQRFPALAPALEKLGAEHKVVAELQEAITALVGAYMPGVSDPVLLRDELARLTAQLEAHFEYEESTVVTALNALGPAPS
ncbi:nitroreductase/quinone reductase family protein [Allokutzneria sp. NRRL B-24872]|uniref:nitroreductase/quinone reductase family protein n=1 Tax=Allokutzneria sp. NRRL B-24872 TaxID=1137961 RepID=UPI000A35E038|nr:nitroreductase/quinone reductase family protein [Allokutzneria sp. NRRL B-24872]